MKKFIISFLLLLIAALPAFAADSIAVVVKGELLSADVEAEIVESRTYVPLRAIAEKLGAKVEWDEETRGISLVTEAARTELAIDSTSASVSSGDKINTVTLEAAPYIKDDRTYVPMRFIAQGLGCQAYWCDDIKTAIITETHSPARDDYAALLNAFLKTDLPDAIRIYGSDMAADIEKSPESVIGYLQNLWFDRASEMLASRLTDKEKKEYFSLSDDAEEQYSYLVSLGEKYGIPQECPATFCPVENNGKNAIVFDADSVRTMDVAPQLVFLSVDGTVTVVRL